MIETKIWHTVLKSITRWRKGFMVNSAKLVANYFYLTTELLRLAMPWPKIAQLLTSPIVAKKERKYKPTKRYLQE